MSLLSLCARLVRDQKINFASHDLNLECLKTIRILATIHYPNGNIEVMCISHRDFRKRWLGWYDTGQIKYVNWLNFEGLNGCCQKWYESGQIEYVQCYKDGKKDGHWQRWFETGQIEYDIWWKDGLQDGHWQGWFESGQIEYDVWLKDGVIVE